MKIWLSKNSEVPVREQLVTQIMLGIVSGDLPIGKRLPSTKEISNRFGVHSNTVSNAYQKLAGQGWLEFRKGSGFYVRAVEGENFNADLKLEKLIADFLSDARKLGFSADEIKKRLKNRFSLRASEKILLVESDKGLRDILLKEIGTATNLEVEGIGFDDFALTHQKSNAVFAAMLSEKAQLENLISPSKIKIYLKARSIPASMTDEKRPSKNDLIAIVSGWEKFLIWSKTILLAANVEPESLILRTTDEVNWRTAVKSAALIICDSLTAKNFKNDPRIRIFQIISDDSLAQLSEIADADSTLF